METNNIGARRGNGSASNGFGWIVAILIVVAIVIAMVSMLTEDEAVILVDEGCPTGVAFNVYTGEACPEESATAFPEGCEPGYLFSDTTGVPCP